MELGASIKKKQQVRQSTHVEPFSYKVASSAAGCYKYIEISVIKIGSG